MSRYVKEIIKAENSNIIFLADDGLTYRIDVTPYIKGSWYGMLADSEYFSLASPIEDGWLIAWPEGQDICPEDIENAPLHSLA